MNHNRKELFLKQYQNLIHIKDPYKNANIKIQWNKICIGHYIKIIHNVNVKRDFNTNTSI